MEACGSSHYWARRFLDMGHEVKLLPPVYVKGLVYGNKHDVNDAKAIALSAVQPESPTVSIKSADQLKLQALMRIRERRINCRTQCSNQIRGILYEHGITRPQGLDHIRKLDTDGLPDLLREMVSDLVEEFNYLDTQAKQINLQIKSLVNAHPIGQQLLTLPGFGVMNAVAALVINPADFRNGRHYAAYPGLVPKQFGTGGKTRIQGISKRGNCYHRTLLCHGARAFINRNKNSNHPLWLWAKRIHCTKGVNVAVAALANKLARISWHILCGQTFDINKAIEIKK